MTGKQYKKIRERVGLSQSQLAKIVGRDEQTISNRERGTYEINKEAALAIRMVEIEHLYDIEVVK